jgi:curli biogenesis system outer membrane secretion channel CsgG
LNLGEGFGLMRRLLFSIVFVVTGCAEFRHIQRSDDGQAAVVTGPQVTANFTPLHTSIACFNKVITTSKRVPTLRIAVGNIKDYTGKASEDDGGAAVTQGAALMMISALGKLGRKVRLIERFDTRVTDMELNYIRNKYLIDNYIRYVRTNSGEIGAVRDLKGGVLPAADYFIVGGITELNFNIQSGGIEMRVNNMGPKMRTYVVSVAADLRIVRTATLEVIKTVSLQKQIVGYEVGAQVFKFFGNTLIDFNTGAKNQEPMQLGVRAIIELGALKLISAVTGEAASSCINEADWQPKKGKPISEAVPAQFKIRRDEDGRKGER